MNPPPARPDDASLRRLSRLARLLDRAFRVPGTQIRLGLDALIGLVPGVGDVTTTALAGWIVIAAARLGAPPVVLVRMLFNVAVDLVVGVIPVLGDVFDVAWKANVRNLALLERHAAEPGRTRRSSALAVAAVVGAIVVLLGLAVWGVIALAGSLLPQPPTPNP